jgi:hypothetical protein
MGVAMAVDVPAERVRTRVLPPHRREQFSCRAAVPGLGGHPRDVAHAEGLGADPAGMTGSHGHPWPPGTRMGSAPSLPTRPARSTTRLGRWGGD